MDAVSYLEDLREDWLNAVIEALAEGKPTADSLRPQLERFYDLLIQALKTGDAAWLDSVLYLWVWSQTITDLESEEASIITALRGLIFATTEVLRSHFPPETALDLMTALQPYWVHVLEYTANQEMQARLEHATAELERIQRELERLDKSKSDFISVAAHELKTPLTLIEGYSAMLKEVVAKEAPPGLKAQIAPFLEGIERGSKRIREIVDDLVDVSLIDNGMLKLSFQPLWLNQIFRSLSDELAPVLRERRLTLQINQFPGIDRVIFGDIERLQQVFRNLLINAIKYTPDGGKITIDGQLLPGFVEVTVSDTGIGIALEDQRRIFEKFGRVGSSQTHSSGKTKFKGGGPGLGLPIAKGIVEAHGGSIWVESPGYDEEKCPGSTFHVLLPLREEPPDVSEKGGIFAKLASYMKSSPLKGGKPS